MTRNKDHFTGGIDLHLSPIVCFGVLTAVRLLEPTIESVDGPNGGWPSKEKVRLLCVVSYTRCTIR